MGDGITTIIIIIIIIITATTTTIISISVVIDNITIIIITFVIIEIVRWAFHDLASRSSGRLVVGRMLAWSEYPCRALTTELSVMLGDANGAK